MPPKFKDIATDTMGRAIQVQAGSVASVQFGLLLHYVNAPTISRQGIHSWPQKCAIRPIHQWSKFLLRKCHLAKNNLGDFSTGFSFQK